MAGIDAHNIIAPSPRAFNKSNPLQNDDEPPRQCQRHTRGHGRSTVSYDMKYHPMDDILRPNFSATRRANGEQIPEEFRDSKVESDEDDEDEALSKVTSPNPHRRRSSRNTHLKKRPIYSAKWHPLDQMLKDNASSTRAVADDNHSKNIRRFSESSSTLKDEDSLSISTRFDHGQGADRASELESTTASITSSPRRSARVSSSQKGPPNYDMKYGDSIRPQSMPMLTAFTSYHVIDSLLRPKAAAKRMKSRLQPAALGKTFITLAYSKKTHSKQCSTVSKTDGFDVHETKSGSRYWRHQKDSVLQGTTIYTGSNIIEFTSERGNQNSEATYNISKGQDKSQARTPTSMQMVTNEEIVSSKPCLRLPTVSEESDREDDSGGGAITETEDTLIESMRGEHVPFSIMSDAALDELLLPAEQYLGKESSHGDAADLLSSDSKGSEPAGSVLAHPNKAVNSVAPEAKAVDLNTSSDRGLTGAVQIKKERTASGLLVGPRGKCDEPRTPKTDSKARKRKSGADSAVTVHEDLPGRTPLIKKIVRMNPASPGTDMPKENLADEGSVDYSSQVERGMSQTRRHQEAIGTPSTRRVRHLGVATTATPPYRSLSSSPGSSWTVR